MYPVFVGFLALSAVSLLLIDSYGLFSLFFSAFSALRFGLLFPVPWAFPIFLDMPVFALCCVPLSFVVCLSVLLRRVFVLVWLTIWLRCGCPSWHFCFFAGVARFFLVLFLGYWLKA